MVLFGIKDLQKPQMIVRNLYVGPVNILSIVLHWNLLYPTKTTVELVIHALIPDIPC